MGWTLPVCDYDLDTLSISVNAKYKGRGNFCRRTPEYNARPSVGGSERSMHRLLFDCVDFKIDSITDAQYEAVRQYLIQRGYQGIFTYDNHRFHIDRGNRDKLTQKDYRKK